jgi:SpoVK/Ycf46/Vps4 family AAA+-type ATPase
MTTQLPQPNMDDLINIAKNQMMISMFGPFNGGTNIKSIVILLIFDHFIKNYKEFAHRFKEYVMNKFNKTNKITRTCTYDEFNKIAEYIYKNDISPNSIISYIGSVIKFSFKENTTIKLGYSDLTIELVSSTDPKNTNETILLRSNQLSHTDIDKFITKIISTKVKIFEKSSTPAEISLLCKYIHDKQLSNDIMILNSIENITTYRITVNEKILLNYKDLSIRIVCSESKYFLYSEELTYNEMIEYVNEIVKNRDETTYFFNQIGSKFSFYKFTTCKNFQNVYGPIDNIIKRLKLFEDVDFYKKRGLQRNLGFLFYGPPGTGKTSCIKAIANFTGRTIINLNLSVSTTKKELRDIFFNDKIITNEKVFNIPINKRLFVIEDMDCLGSFVLKRDKNNNGTNEHTKELSLLTQKIEQLELENKQKIKRSRKIYDAEEEGGTFAREFFKELKGIKKEKEEKKEEKKEVSDIFKNIDMLISAYKHNYKTYASLASYYGYSTSGKTIVDVNSKAYGQYKGEPFSIPVCDLADYYDNGSNSSVKISMSIDNEPIDLSFLLNILDGTLETSEGRMIIATSNFHDKLDSALIRPGRFDVKIHFDYCTIDTINKMFEDFYETKDFEFTFTEEYSGKITPAEIQTVMCNNITDPNAAYKETHLYVDEYYKRIAKEEHDKNKIEELKLIIENQNTSPKSSSSMIIV